MHIMSSGGLINSIMEEASFAFINPIDSALQLAYEFLCTWEFPLNWFKTFLIPSFITELNKTFDTFI